MLAELKLLLRDPVARAILLVALLVRLAFAAEVARFDLDLSKNPMLDMVFLHENAARIAAGDVRLVDPYVGGYDVVRTVVYGPERYERLFGKHTYFDSPGYLYFAAACEKLGGSVYATVLAQELLGTLTCALVYALARRHGGIAAGRVALALAALSLEAVTEAGFYLREPLLAFLCTWTVFAFDDASRKGTARAWAVAGVALGLGWATKVSFNFLVPLVPLLAWTGAPDGKDATTRARATRTARACAAFALGTLVGVGPIAARNVSLGVPPFRTSVVPLSAVISRNHAGYPGFGAALRHAEEHRLIEQSGDTFRGAWLAAIRSYPDPIVDYPRSLARKLAYFAMAVDFWDNVRSSYLAQLSPILRLCVVRWGALVPLAAIGLVVGVVHPGRRRAMLPLVAAFFALGILVALLGGVCSRYRLVVEPLACVLFAVTAVDLAILLRRRNAAALAIVGVAALLFALLRDPQPPLTKQALRSYVLGTWTRPGPVRHLLDGVETSGAPGP